MKVLFKRGRRGGRLQSFVGHDEKEQKYNHALAGKAVYDIGLLPQRCCAFCAGYQSAVNMAVFNASQVETHFSMVFENGQKPFHIGVWQYKNVCLSWQSSFVRSRRRFLDAVDK